MGGGSKSTSVTIPQWLEDAAKSSLGRAEQVSRTGYAPYYGPDVAALTPMQVAAMQGTNQMASAFGSPTADPMAGMQPAGNYDGMAAYSSGPMYDAALAELQRRQPETYAKLMAPFSSGQYGLMPGSAGSASSSVPAMNERGGRDVSYGGGGRGTTSMDTVGSYAPGGVNTANPGSFGNRMAATATSRSQGAPTQADRPVSRSSAAGGGSGGMGGGK